MLGEWIQKANLFYLAPGKSKENIYFAKGKDNKQIIIQTFLNIFFFNSKLIYNYSFWN